MKSENILVWNLPNWISVVLMVLVGFALLAALAQFARKRVAPAPATATQQQ